jgi:hypothetical protein
MACTPLEHAISRANGLDRRAVRFEVSRWARGHRAGWSNVDSKWCLSYEGLGRSPVRRVVATVAFRSVRVARSLVLAGSNKDARRGGKRSRCLHGVRTLE